MRPLFPDDSAGEAVHFAHLPVAPLNAGKDVEEYEDWVGASYKMDQQCCCWVQLDPKLKDP